VARGMDMSEMPSRVEARRALLAVLAGHDAAGRRIPCHAVPVADRGAWTSDDPDDQALAARLCGPCPAIEACRLYGSTFPKECGVYGAMTEHDRRPTVERRPTQRAS